MPQPHPAQARRHALELVLAPADDAAVRARWELVEHCGAPSSGRHQGATHRPHVTVLAGPPPGPEVLRAAVEGWGGLLPLELPVAGLVLLGGPRRVALADLLVAPAEMLGARVLLQEVWEGSDPRAWVPHLTLAPRLTAAQVGQVVAGLGDGIRAVRATGLRWWDPDRERVHELLGQES